MESWTRISLKFYLMLWSYDSVTSKNIFKLSAVSSILQHFVDLASDFWVWVPLFASSVTLSSLTCYCEVVLLIFYPSGFSLNLLSRIQIESYDLKSV